MEESVERAELVRRAQPVVLVKTVGQARLWPADFSGLWQPELGRLLAAVLRAEAGVSDRVDAVIEGAGLDPNAGPGSAALSAALDVAGILLREAD